MLKRAAGLVCQMLAKGMVLIGVGWMLSLAAVAEPAVVPEGGSRYLSYAGMLSAIEVDDSPTMNPFALRFSAIRYLTSSLSIEFQLAATPFGLGSDSKVRTFRASQVQLESQLVGAGSVLLRWQAGNWWGIQPYAAVGSCYCVADQTRIVFDSDLDAFVARDEVIDRGGLVLGGGLQWHTNKRFALFLDVLSYSRDNALDFTGISFGLMHSF